MIFGRRLKYACETCIKGHRARDCLHFERINEGSVFLIKDRGRPAKDMTAASLRQKYRLLQAGAHPTLNEVCPFSGNFRFGCKGRCCPRKDVKAVFIDDQSSVLVSVFDDIEYSDDWYFEDTIPESAVDGKADFYANNGHNEDTKLDKVTKPKRAPKAKDQSTTNEPNAEPNSEPNAEPVNHQNNSSQFGGVGPIHQQGSNVISQEEVIGGVSNDVTNAAINTVANEYEDHDNGNEDYENSAGLIEDPATLQELYGDIGLQARHFSENFQFTQRNASVEVTQQEQGHFSHLNTQASEFSQSQGNLFPSTETKVKNEVQDDQEILDDRHNHKRQKLVSSSTEITESSQSIAFGSNGSHYPSNLQESNSYSTNTLPSSELTQEEIDETGYWLHDFINEDEIVEEDSEDSEESVEEVSGEIAEVSEEGVKEVPPENPEPVQQLDTFSIASPSFTEADLPFGFSSIFSANGVDPPDSGINISTNVFSPDGSESSGFSSGNQFY